jgi:hypothetical protein
MSGLLAQPRKAIGVPPLLDSPYEAVTRELRGTMAPLIS